MLRVGGLPALQALPQRVRVADLVNTWTSLSLPGHSGLGSGLVYCLL